GTAGARNSSGRSRGEGSASAEATLGTDDRAGLLPPLRCPGLGHPLREEFILDETRVRQARPGQRASGQPPELPDSPLRPSGLREGKGREVISPTPTNSRTLRPSLPHSRRDV